mmetsp:Transcript_28655/g.40951  ORF Transcript_28655/g.40951 Transcript_28655/m.40951 type:complete len:589 (-) Transcript_28655:161-1927(-)|eukprot:CAMPEP_0201704234 /NCGR_PEP_ID=MMETSP0578-20130828/42199_1 /ASSEMBLY_ACC=CAM_ASM_000663 /TAXON_ID=267565 /ORGANISM="Skeletonema grethea, Strain CCMP 1804" /LENGTH=588 /DNA_ID=CAMNT_0048192223 /DNA_START=68 /DNA_END=1834 /DNA_ORIENTATION=-
MRFPQAILLLGSVGVVTANTSPTATPPSDYTCFVNQDLFDPSITTLTLQTAVGKYFGNTWDASDTEKYGPIEEWCTSQITSFDQIFLFKPDFNADISGWDTTSATSMSAMFEGAHTFNQDISGWDVSKVKNMQSMFNDAKAFNQDISIWSTAAANTMGYMFKSAESFNIDISNWDVSNVSFVNGMFNGALQFNQDLSPWKEHNFPFTSATDIFTDSGCEVKTSPESEDDTVCAPPPPTPSPTTPVNIIPSWALMFDSFSTNFTKGSESELTLTYKMGNGRDNNVKLFAKGCVDEITGAVISHTKTISSIEDDPSLQQLHVFVEVDKKTIAESNIWNSEREGIEMCVRVQLTSPTTGVIKELQRNIGIDFNMEVAFTAESPVQLEQIFLNNEETTADVEDYILACTCGGILEPCNTNILGPSDFLNVCIRSRDPEMKINYLQSLQMVQEKQDGSDNTFVIVNENGLQDSSISSKAKLPDESLVHVASVIPADFFSYESTTTAEINGVVFLKLAGSRRRLVVEMAGDPNLNAQASRALQAVGDQESRFAIEVELEKNELELGSAADNSFGSLMSGVIAVAIGAIAAAMSW